MMNERLRDLIDIAGLDELAKVTDIKGTRWRTVRYDKRTRVSTEEVEELVQLFPEYALWLTTGKIAPEIGQTSPAYDLANEKLQEPNAG
jgi:hypothetical protein